MKKKFLDNKANKLVNAFLKNKIIAPLPKKYTKKLSEAQKFRKLCESKIKETIIGFKAAGTSISVMKKLKEKEPFYASIYKRNLLKRKIREQVISSNLYGSVSFGVSFFIIYNSKEILGSKEIKAALEVIAQKLALKN